MRRLRPTRAVIILFLLWRSLSPGQNVFIVVIDGARSSETFVAGGRNIPRIWNELRPQGTLFTNFRNEGITVTNPGHSALITGTWQTIANDGSERPTMPTVFEYFRKTTGASDRSCYVVAGKKKLNILTHSTHREYGSDFSAGFVSPENPEDVQTWEELVKVMDLHHPRLVVVNFPSVDLNGHARDWNGYLGAIRRADSLVFLLWQKVQGDSAYRSRTTLFVTSDHGRHDRAHGGFRHHGDSCEGCRRIMLLALGPGFNPNAVVRGAAYQIDVARTVAAIMGFNATYAEGRNLLQLTGIRSGKRK